MTQIATQIWVAAAVVVAVARVADVAAAILITGRGGNSMTELPNISRRDLLCGVAAVVASVTLPRIADGQQVRLPDVGIMSSHPEFKAVLASNFPGYDNNPGLSALLPHTYIFQNTTGRHLRALSIDWQIPLKHGGTKAHTVHYMAHSRKKIDPRIGFSKEGRTLAGRRTIIRSGEHFIVTPLFFCSSFSYRMLAKSGQLAPLTSKVLSSKHKMLKHLAHAPGGTTSIATVRSTIHPHSEMATRDEVGQDANLQRHFFARRRAEQDEAKYILELINQGHKRPELRRVLKAHSQQEILKTKPGHPRVYARAQRQYARHLLRLVKKHKSLPLTKKMLEAIVNAPSEMLQINSVLS